MTRTVITLAAILMAFGLGWVVRATRVPLAVADPEIPVHPPAASPAQPTNPAVPTTGSAVKGPTTAEVKDYLRRKWAADHTEMQRRINRYSGNTQRQAEFDRWKSAIAAFAIGAPEPDDVLRAINLDKWGEQLKRDVGFYILDFGLAPPGSVPYLGELAKRDHRLPGPFGAAGNYNLDRELQSYAACLVNYPELKDAVLLDLAKLLRDGYEETLFKHPQAGYGNNIFHPNFEPIPFFSRHVPDQPLLLEHTTVAEFPADAMARAKKRDAGASKYQLRRLVWAEWLMENRGLQPYCQFVTGVGQDMTGRLFTFEHPDHSRPTLAGCYHRVRWNSIRDTAK